LILDPHCVEFKEFSASESEIAISAITPSTSLISLKTIITCPLSIFPETQRIQLRPLRPRAAPTTQPTNTFIMQQTELLSVH
jgi:hypothetical protein